MANEHPPPAPHLRVSAGTAFKTGFFAAFGVLVFTLVLSVVLAVVALVLAAVGMLPGVARLFSAVVLGP